MIITFDVSSADAGLIARHLRTLADRILQVENSEDSEVLFDAADQIEAAVRISTEAEENAAELDEFLFRDELADEELQAA